MAVVATQSPSKSNFLAQLKGYFALTKPSISLLVVITAIPSLLMARGELPSLWTSFWALFGCWLASASAAVFNQIVEADIDHQMKRTSGRSIPSGKVLYNYAFAFASLIGISAFGLLWTLTTPLAAVIALLGHGFYVLVYTLYLKPRTVQNIVIGGIAGAVGPLIGWAAVTGSLAWPAWILFGIITLWTPPHFWSLAIKYKEDYAKVNIPMYPVVYGDERTRKVILQYTFTLWPLILSLYFGGVAGLVYLIPSLLFTFKFSYDALKLYLSHDNELAMPFFHYSCFYTFGVFGALTLDRFLSFN